jgi:hypothetical protein
MVENKRAESTGCALRACHAWVRNELAALALSLHRWRWEEGSATHNANVTSLRALLHYPRELLRVEQRSFMPWTPSSAAMGSALLQKPSQTTLRRPLAAMWRRTLMCGLIS